MIEDIVIYGISTGTAGLAAGLALANTVSYIDRKKEIINKVKEGIEPNIRKEAYTPILDKISNAGEYLAEKRYEEGKYDDIIKKYQKKL